MPTAAELARERNRIRTTQVRRRKLRHRLEDRLHHVTTAIRVGARKAARLDKRIARQHRHTGDGLSARGAAFIAHFEGTVLHAYDDAAGHCTIGIGHLLSMARCSVSGHSGETISSAKALDLLESDAALASNAVRDDVKVPLSQPQTDALISFTFNEGTGSLASSTLLKRLNAGDYKSVPSELMRWTFADGHQLAGLVARRQAEGDLFAHSNYG